MTEQLPKGYMISMTGMGRAQGVVCGTMVRVEVKSVNHRFCDVYCRLPGKFQALEIAIQHFIKKNFTRGKIDVHVSEDKSAGASETDIKAFRSCHAYLQRVHDELQLKGDVALADILSVINAWIHNDAEPDVLWQGFEPVLLKALNGMKEMRSGEGANLRVRMEESLKRIGVFATSIAAKKDILEADLRRRLEEKITSRAREIAAVDPARLQMETLFCLERMDITEELERLESHLKQMQTVFTEREASGRKIDFLLQEFNREFNTIGSKAQNSEVSHIVVEAKVELEKLREQTQNIE